MSGHRGAVLFEVLLSLALFVGAATFALGATRSVLTSLDRAGRDALAADLAASLLAELESGLTNIATLREAADGLSEIGSGRVVDDGVWSVDVDTERSEFTGLTLVKLTVFEAEANGSSVTLRQLVRLRPDDEVEAFEEDELLRDLPDEEPAP